MSEVKKPLELTIRKTEWSDDQGIETEWDIYDPKCHYMYVGVPEITDIPMIEKSAYLKAVDALKKHGHHWHKCLWHVRHLERDCQCGLSNILKELGVEV